MEKKMEMLIGGSEHEHAVALTGPVPSVPTEEITTVDDPRRRSSAPPSALDADIAYHEGASAVFARSVGAAALSPEHASALRQVRHEPEPIPAGALYAVQGFDDLGKPCGAPTEAATHADAVTKCEELNERSRVVGDTVGVWFGVVPVAS